VEGFHGALGDVARMIPGGNPLEWFKALKVTVDNHQMITDLRNRYPSEYELDPSPARLREYIASCENCATCPGLDRCPSPNRGHFLEPVTNDIAKQVAFRYKPCQLQLAAERRSRIERCIQSHYIPDDILQTTFADLEPDAQRLAAITAAMAFCKSFVAGNKKTGLYIHGPFGVGKSALGGAIANELARHEVDVVFIYWPDFMGEIKDAIDSGQVESKISALRDVSVLIIDDIGAESLTRWTRDEVLGPVLQRRMNNKATVFTSNLTQHELEAHLAVTKDDRQPNPKKAARLMERIEPFVKVVRMGGRNRRREK